MGVFDSVVTTLMQNNAFHLFFPWLLILTVTYGALNKYDVFEEETTIGVTALAVSFISIGGIYQFAPPSMFANLAAALAFGVFGIFGLLVLFAVAGIDPAKEPSDSSKTFGPIQGLMLIGALIIGIVSFVGVIAYQLNVESILGGVENGYQQVVMPILILVFILLLVRGVGGNKKKKD